MTFPHCSVIKSCLLPSNDTMTSNLSALTLSALLLAVITILTILFNTIIIFAVVRSLFKAQNNTSLNDNITPQILIMSMSAIGSLYGILAMPMGVLEVIDNGEWPLGKGFCSARHACNQFLGTNFMIHVMCLSIDRYIAVCKPLKYRLLTFKTGLVMTAVSWLTSSLTTVATRIVLETQADVIARLLHYTSSTAKPEYNIFTDKTFVLANFLLWNSPFFVSYFLYGFILLEVYRYNKRTQTRLKAQHFESGQSASKYVKSENNNLADVGQTGYQKSVISPGNGASCISAAHGHSEPTEGKKKEADQTFAHRRPNIFKALRTVGLIMICYTLCWLPAWLYLTWLFEQSLSIPLWSEILVLWITYVNSALNPIIYCTYKPVSRAVKSLFGT